MKKVIFWILVYCFAVSRLGLAAEDVPKPMLLPFPNQAGLPAKTELPMAVPAPEVSPAYQQYLKRPKSELSKILYLIELIKRKDLKILYNGRPYQPSQIVTLVKAHIALNYRKEKAEDWIKANAYQSRSKGQVIYVQDPDGKCRILRDLLLEELAKLPA